jgi:SAM-dependent methyltransferase
MKKRKSKNPLFDFNAVFEPNDYLHFYRNRLTEERTKYEVDFLIRELNLKKSMKILDLACGHGRHSNRLAKLGFNVVGIDTSKGFLELAKKEALRKKIKVKYQRMDMRKFLFKNHFDAIFLLLIAFGYFDDKQNKRILKNVAGSLKPGGLFCLDMKNRDYVVNNLQPYEVTEKDKDLMIERHSVDSDTGRLYNRRIVIRNGKRKDKPFFIRIYSYTEIRKLLSVIGLKIQEVFGNWDASTFSSSSERMIIIARKIKTNHLNFT